MRKSRTNKVLVILILMVTIFQCKKDPQPENELVPLDGRGGGIIAYCLQPPSGSSSYKLFAMNTDGIGIKQLITASLGLNHHDWSPDGGRIVAVGYFNFTYT